MAERGIICTDVYNNGIAYDDVTAGEASAGDVADYSVTLKNSDTRAINHLYAWVNQAVQYITISHNGVAYVSPKGEAKAPPTDKLALADIPPGDSITFYLRRTIPASTLYDPHVLVVVHWEFFGSL